VSSPVRTERETAASLLVGDQVNVDHAGEPGDLGAVALPDGFAPPAPPGHPDDDHRGVDPAREVDHRAGHVLADDRVERPAQRLHEPALLREGGGRGAG
jgi:hypothetical protein